MRWGLFAALLVMAYFGQTMLIGRLGWNAIDLFLILACAVSFGANRHDARIAAWLTGFVQDLGSTGPLGVHAFALGAASVFVTVARGWADGRVWWIRAIIAFIAALIAEAVLWVADPAAGDVLIRRALSTATVTAIALTLLGVAPLWLGWRGRRWSFVSGR
ncbi:MAG: rod shape-determining protein MreD [Phycisphaerales bacterium]|nr:rod shape-determining protein MreD [Phycisphaerales bacterium]